METILLCKTKNLLSSSYRNSFNISFIMKTAFVFFYLLFSFTAIIAQNPIAYTVQVPARRPTITRFLNSETAPAGANQRDVKAL